MYPPSVSVVMVLAANVTKSVSPEFEAAVVIGAGSLSAGKTFVFIYLTPKAAFRFVAEPSTLLLTSSTTAFKIHLRIELS